MKILKDLAALFVSVICAAVIGTVVWATCPSSFIGLMAGSVLSLIIMFGLMIMFDGAKR